MSTPPDPLDRLSALWQPPARSPRWVVWHVGGAEVLVFDREFNIPADVPDADLPEVVRRMRRAGAPEYDDYPGRRCG
ncbi:MULTISPECIES: hypothetical protein [unclassified Streptomyces]|uniref:hypothetical protein n=1 Tax=unclassified Streptomyces TaxID=2593676 RepID=UPI0006AFB624|nr:MULTISPECIES: hypothetical protein [unclassified Streptomyces]KOX29819.1 hypothetical protein ADL06_12700 [Streptomyces sp. NRRL F-6491]KOX43335.1 hypothetical protein ADL08_14865 [Streptomyces sp. NRRL F-6492]